ncbi:GTP-binding protein [archaeon]|nr:MAG: GTP-binding protein [archaeon]
MPTDKVPVTIVTGALGAGKTSLLRRIVTERHGARIAVIENEFADSIGIESLILKDGVGGAPADGFFELANGCICCSVRDGLVATLTTLMKQREKFDYILVETSGLANPGPVASIFWTDLDEDASLKLDGIVTLVDAANFHTDLVRRREEGAVNEVAQQVAYADCLVLNKVDLVTPDALEKVKHDLRSMNGAASMLTCTRAEVPITSILNLRAFETSDVCPPVAIVPAALATLTCGCSGGAPHAPHAHGDSNAEHAPLTAAAACGEAPPAHAAVAGLHGADVHVHDAGVSSTVVTTAEPVNIDAFRLWLATLLWEDGGAPEVSGSGSRARVAESIFRMKGLLWAAPPAEYLLPTSDGAGIESSPLSPSAAGPSPFICQVVHEQFELEPATGDAAVQALALPLPRISKLVVIGAHLVPAELQAQFSAACRG